jgi:isoleucyl-tRNA synthetase
VFLTSQIEFVDSPDRVRELCPDFHLSTELDSSPVLVGVCSADGTKCERCWFFSPTVGHHHKHSDICSRCAHVIETDGHVINADV